MGRGPPISAVAKRPLPAPPLAATLYTQEVTSLVKVRRSKALLLLAVVFLYGSAGAHGQSASETQMGEEGGRVILVLPFENHSAQPALDWIGDSFPDTLNQRFQSAGFLTINREDRQFALEHLGLPSDFKPSRATTVRIGQTLDADFIVVGSFTIQDKRISANAQILRVNRLNLSAPLSDSSELARLLDVENALAWKVARAIDPRFSVAQQTFLAASNGVRLSSFENYIRGLDAVTPQERIKHLQSAVQETPTYTAALLALGKAQFSQRDYDHAAATFARIPPTDRRSLEAEFFLGLARFNTAKYEEAEAAFAFVASRLPLPEVVNNQAVSSSRQGHDATALFQRAVAADPNDADYHYNLAVSLMRRHDAAGAQREIAAALKLRPADKEAADLRSRLTSGHVSTVAANPSGAPASGDDADFLERIRRTYSEASFRQAAFQLDQMRTLRMSSLPAAERSKQYTQLGNDYLAQGLLPEAEQEFEASIASDPSSFSGHAGLAQIREHSGSPAEARAEAEASLKLKQNPVAYLVLARLELRERELAASAADVGNALRLDPKNSAAQGMRQALQARGQAIP